MASGGNSDNLTNRLRVQRSILNDGGCTFCKPNRTENEGRRDGKYVDGKFRVSKSKDNK